MRKRNGKIIQASHAGFSLIAVLIIAVIGMALIGVTFYIYESSVGQGAITMQRSQEYNAMQAGMEEAKSVLVARCDNLDPVPKWYDGKAAGSKIGSPGDLVIKNGTLFKDVKIKGENVQVKIEILDAAYSESDLNGTVTQEELMPPGLRITEGTQDHLAIGAYLIRATLTIDGETKRLETLVYQRNRVTSMPGSSSGGGDDGDGNTNP